MQLEHSFVVPVGIDEAWEVLTDVQRVAPCMPGATVDEVNGEQFTGTVRVKLGPIALSYKGVAHWHERDETARQAVIHARGRDARGNGTAQASIRSALESHADGTRVTIVTDLQITGKPAQFGRGVITDVSDKLIGQFAACLADKLAGADQVDAQEPPATAGAIGLFEVAAPALAKRAAPLAFGVAAVLALAFALGRRRRV